MHDGPTTVHIHTNVFIVMVTILVQTVLLFSTRATISVTLRISQLELAMALHPLVGAIVEEIGEVSSLFEAKARLPPIENDSLAANLSKGIASKIMQLKTLDMKGAYMLTAAVADSVFDAEQKRIISNAVDTRLASAGETGTKPMAARTRLYSI